jgi:hypothetical protein
LLTQAYGIRANGCSTGTNLPFDDAIRRKVKFDNIILVTDGGQNCGRPCYEAWDEYKRKINRNAKLFVVDVSPYGKALVKGFDNANDCHYIVGWSDNVLNYIGLASQGWNNMVDYIEASK